MTIHFFIDTSFPYGMAAAKRRLCYAKGLKAEGDTVKVHICHKCFNQGDDDGFPQKGMFKDIPYNYICGKYKHRNKILRGLDWYIFDSMRSFFYALKEVKRKEAMYVYMYPLFIQILLIIVAKLKGAKIVKETCEHPLALGNVHSKWHRFCCWFEFHFVMPFYDGFIAISRELDQFVCKYKSKKAQSIIVPILVENADTVDYSKQKSPYNVPYIIHTGTMLEQKDSISKIMHAFARYKKESNSDVKLVFTGPQANSKCSYLPLITELGIDKDVELLGLVSVEQIALLQHFAAITIIYKSDNLQTRNCFPTKLGEMLISGVPVITTTVGDSNLYLENGKSALIFEPDDEDTLVFYIKKVLANPDAFRQMGEAGKFVAEKYFSPIAQGKRLSLFFRDLLTNNNRRGGVNRLTKRLMSPEKYARRIGVNLGIGNFIPDKDSWSSEPYLITIGNHCQITKGVRIFTHGGGQVVRQRIPNFDTFGKVLIGDYVYIGNNALIMPGVKIDSGSLIAAGSVVTKSVPAGVVVGGNPAKIICTVDEYLMKNIRYDIGSKAIEPEVKKHLLQSIPKEKFISKEYMKYYNINV